MLQKIKEYSKNIIDYVYKNYFLIHIYIIIPKN